MGAVTTSDSDVGVLSIDGDGRITAVNDFALTWLGLDRSDVVGRPFAELMVDAPDDLPLPPEVGPRMMVLPGRPGRAAIVQGSERAGARTVTFLDATDRYAALAELRSSFRLAERTRRRLELVISASLEFSSTVSEDHLAETLALAAVEAYGASQSAVFLFDDGGRLALRFGEDPLERAPAATLAAVDAGGVVTVSDPTQARKLSAALADAFDATGVHAVLFAPIRHEDITLGMLGCYFRRDRMFDGEAAPFAEALANEAARALVALRLQRQLAHAAAHDMITGLPNRRVLERWLAEARPDDGTVAALFIDLDGFKAVNDHLGHEVGDEVLREVARRLLAGARDDDVVVRYGGDEFVVLCRVGDADDATVVAERLRAAISAPIDWLSDGHGVTASIGIAVASDGRIDERSLLRAADAAMYAAKTSGGDHAHLELL